MDHAGSQPRKSYSPLREKKSNSPSRVADALKDSHLVGSNYTASYGRPLPSHTPPRNVPATYQPLVNDRKVSGSPLRQKSPPRVPLHASNQATLHYSVVTQAQAQQAQVTNNSEFIDESYARMKKSCERIAAVLGITRNTSTSPNIDNLQRSQLDTIHNMSPMKAATKHQITSG